MLSKSDRTIKGWVAGTNTPTYNGHIEVMKILGLENDGRSSSHSLISVSEIPVLDFVQAGEFTESLNEIDPINYIQVPSYLVPRNAFSLKVQGESMLYDESDAQILNYKYSKYTLYEGENILIDPNEITPQNLVGKVVVARNPDGATVKLLYKQNKQLCLMPLNSKFQNNKNIQYPENSSIIGKVVGSINIRDFK